MLAIIITLCEAVAYVWSGSYGDVEQIGTGTALMIVIQLTFAGCVVIMLDEMLQSGYGMGSGISLFIATNICENIVWKSFSPITIRSGSGTEFEGAVISVLHKLFTEKNKVRALLQATSRSNAPNINNLLATILIFLVVIYFQVLPHCTFLTIPRASRSSFR